MPEDNTAEQTPAPDHYKQRSIELDEPIQRGKTTITTLTLRRPMAGALRGVALVDLLRMESGALQKVLPRVTDPALTEHDVRAMNPGDLMQLGEELGEMCLPKKYREDPET